MKNQLQFLIKAVLLLTVYCSLNTAFAQAPQKMGYQAVVRNAANSLVANTLVGVKISVLQTTATGTVVYSERHTPTTNINGLATFEIGGGTVLSGTMAGINWANGPYFIKTETDPAGGTNYTIAGTSQLASVPYALFAANAVPSALSWNITGTNISNNNAGNVGIGIATPTEKLHVDGQAKIGNAVWDTAADDKVLKFGDASFVTIGEVGGDDKMVIKANEIKLALPSNGNVVVPAGNIGLQTGTAAIANKLQIGNPPNFGGNDIAIGNGTQAMSLFQSPTASTFYSNNNFAFMPASGPANVGIGTDLPTSKLQVNGSLGMKYTVVNNYYTLTADDNIVYVDMGSNPSFRVNISLPAAASCPGRIYIIKAINMPDCPSLGQGQDRDRSVYGTEPSLSATITGLLQIIDAQGVVTALFRQNFFNNGDGLRGGNKRTSATVQSIGSTWMLVDSDHSWWYDIY